MKSTWHKAIIPFIWWCITLLPLLIIRAIAVIIGLFVVPIALTRTDWQASNGKDMRLIKVLPRWAWLWSNDHDGLLGDKRLAWPELWANKYYPRVAWLKWTGLVSEHVNCYAAMFWWAAIRNPVNNMRYTRWFNCILPECYPVQYIGDEQVSNRTGMGGIQFVWAYTRNNGIPMAGLYYVKIYKSGLKCFRLRIGYKIDPDDTDEVGWCFVPNPYMSVK